MSDTNTFLPFKNTREERPCRKINQAQPRVIIFTNFAKLESQSSMPSFKIIRLHVLVLKKSFAGFYHMGMVAI